MRGVGVVEAATVRPELLDDFLARDRSSGHRLVATGDGRDRLDVVEVLDDPTRDQYDRADHTDREQDADDGADEVHPEVAELVGTAAGEAADQRDRHRDADRRAGEVLYREPGHLYEITERRLTRVRLPVGVRDEAGCRVECLPLFHPGETEAEQQLAL